MTPRMRKFGLTAHITVSVAWIGAVVSFLVLSIAGLRSQDPEIVRGAYLAMDLIGEFVIVPLSFAALATGVIQSLGTPWGLFRHYWILLKLVLTIGATFLLLLHQFNAVAVAARSVSATPAGTLPEMGKLGVQLVGDAAGAIVVLLVITVLAVYKPWGRTRYGQRKEREASTKIATSGLPIATNAGQEPNQRLPLSLKIFLAILGVLVTSFIVLHLAGGGMKHHGH